MSVRILQDQKATAREMFVPQGANGNAVVVSGTRRGNTLTSDETRPDRLLNSGAEKRFGEVRDRPVTRTFIGSRQHSETLAQRRSPRIAFKVKGRILFMDPAEIAAVQAAGNYVVLQHRPNPYMLRETLSSIAEKLKPYGFIRIHRSVIVNALVVEEIQPLQTGEYSLRVKGGKEYMVTRKYKENLRHLAQLWLGSERLCD